MASSNSVFASFANILLVFSVVLQLIGANELARGWGDKIDWVNLDEGLKHAEEYKKPLMLIIHKSWCGACKNLKPNFAASQELQTLSKHFIMVNVQDDEEPSDAMYKPDGGYIPRILFLDPNGRVRQDIFNQGGNESYKFYYYNANSIVTSMHRALDQIKAVPKQPIDEL
ncbi:thioredoxin domain-containing protein 12-like [Lineus longissimus]|uniref:thioredoxin domain-containing protein 12-like n=1 Tax=Lineus longissimus TaxID=88925 RepID=UPI002B4E585A